MDPLIQDQEFIAARIESAEYFADIPVLVERRGVTESDIIQALSTLNEKQARLGACVIVLKPSLLPTTADAPGPEYRISQSVQVITQPLMNDSDQGTGKQTEEIAGQLRALLHRFAGPNGTYSFSAMQAETVEEGKDSYSLTFTRLARDAAAAVGLPLISPDEGASPQEITLSCATAGASILYTLDGSYPSPANRAALAYADPFTVQQACTLLAAAYKPGLLPSGLAAASFT